MWCLAQKAQLYLWSRHACSGKKRNNHEIISCFCWRWWLKKRVNNWDSAPLYNISRCTDSLTAFMNNTFWVLLVLSMSKQIKWHHLKWFMSFHKAPSGTTNACMQLLFHTCNNTSKACKQTLMCQPCWIYKGLNYSTICSNSSHPTCSATCTRSPFLFSYGCLHVLRRD